MAGRRLSARSTDDDGKLPYVNLTCLVFYCVGSRETCGPTGKYIEIE